MWLVKAVENAWGCCPDECLCILHIYLTATFIKGLGYILLCYQPIPVYIKVPEYARYKIISYTNEFFEIEHHTEVLRLTYFISISDFFKQFFYLRISHFLIWILKWGEKNLSNVYWSEQPILSLKNISEMIL